MSESSWDREKSKQLIKIVNRAMKEFADKSVVSNKTMQQLNEILKAETVNADELLASLGEISKSSDPAFREAASAVALYHKYVPGTTSQYMISGVLADYIEDYVRQHGWGKVRYVSDPRSNVFHHVTTSLDASKTAKLTKDIEAIASVVLNNKDQKEMQALKDVSGQIVKEYIDMMNDTLRHPREWITEELRISFKGKVKVLWESFVQKLDSFTAAGKERNEVKSSIKDFVMGKSRTMRHRNTITPSVSKGQDNQQKLRGRGQ